MVLRTGLALLAVLASARTVYVWQGLDYSWQHRVAGKHALVNGFAASGSNVVFPGFETPHRLGSWQSRLDQTQRRLNVSFTPGVNGDFGFPTARVTAVNASWLTATFSTTFSDRVNNDSAPTARTMLEKPIPSSAGLFAFINGFDLSMACNTSCAVCNSNGDWISALNMTLVPATATAETMVAITLERGWSPSHGGGKPLSTCMSYRLQLDVVLIRPAIVASTASIPFQASLFDHISVAQLTSALPASSAFGVPVITGFGWQLYGNESNHGRYLERFNFSVTPCTYPTVDSCQYNVYAGLQSPAVTTFPATVRTTMQTAVVWLTSDSAPTAIGLVNGTVCKSDPTVLLDCALRGMPEQLSDSVAW